MKPVREVTEVEKYLNFFFFISSLTDINLQMRKLLLRDREMTTLKLEVLVEPWSDP